MTLEYTIGFVTPPADMMDAARKSLSATGFANLMERTQGRTPTPAELVEFADAERLAGVAAPYECNVVGELQTSADGISAELIGSNQAQSPN